MAFDESLAARIRDALAAAETSRRRRCSVEGDDQLKAWVERATKFVRTLPKK